MFLNAPHDQIAQKASSVSQCRILLSCCAAVDVFGYIVLSISEVLVICLQQSIAKGVEEKMSGDQRKYLLMEQLKAIKKVIIVGC